MFKECSRCLFRCQYLKEKDKFMRAVASRKMDSKHALELIDIWKQEAESIGCDELKQMPDMIDD